MNESTLQQIRTSFEELEKRIMNEFNLTDDQCFVFMDYLTSNSDGSKFLIYGDVWMRVKGVDNICFAALIEKKTIQS